MFIDSNLIQYAAAVIVSVVTSFDSGVIVFPSMIIMKCEGATSYYVYTKYIGPTPFHFTSLSTSVSPHLMSVSTPRLPSKLFSFSLSACLSPEFRSLTNIRKMVEIKSQAEKDKTLVSAVIKRSDIFGESAGGAGLDDKKVKEVRNAPHPSSIGLM
jgi:hypothetical protein